MHKKFTFSFSEGKAKPLRNLSLNFLWQVHFFIFWAGGGKFPSFGNFFLPLWMPGIIDIRLVSNLTKKMTHSSIGINGNPHFYQWDGKTCWYFTHYFKYENEYPSDANIYRYCKWPIDPVIDHSSIGLNRLSTQQCLLRNDCLHFVSGHMVVTSVSQKTLSS